MRREQNIPKKYLNKWKDNNKIVSFDSQGWPQYKQNVRDFLIAFGCTYNEKSNIWTISDSNPILDTEICTYDDDGMGYGTNLEYPIECNCFSSTDGQHYCNIFKEKKLDNIELWLKTPYYPGAHVKMKNIKREEKENNFILDDIFKDKNDKIAFKCRQYYLSEEDKSWKEINNNINLNEEEIEF